MKIFISGASTGLGYSLALEYANSETTLGIAARSKDKLDDLQQQLEAKGATVFSYKIDVRQKEETQKACLDFISSAGGIDIVVANAGVKASSGQRYVATEKLTEIIDINVNGLIHVANSFLPYMLEHKQGHIVATGSVAGFRGLPGGTYSASKAAVKNLMDSWRVSFSSENIYFTTLCPGFIATPMTDVNEFKMPFLISSEEAAVLMKKAIKSKEKTYIFPWQWKFVVPLMEIVPEFILSYFKSKMG